MDIQSPKGTEEYFKKLSDSEFDGNKGFTLKFLCDLHKGYFPTGTEEIDAKFDLVGDRLSELNSRINNLESSRDNEDIISVGGNKIGGRK